MRAIRKSSSHQSCTPNILPCRIQHNGSVDASQRFWSPVSGENGTKTSYFRGRKLYGRPVKIPKGYKGAVLVGSQKILEQNKENEADHTKISEAEETIEMVDEEEEEEVRIMEEVGDFNEVLIWGHEAVANSEDIYVRSLEEWIGVAESVSPAAFSAKG
ncbi:hypothetical protein OIDMADRAFT_125382 [Oidiodendron maius Zn]|uniref:Uncharacterized protein n=1 Tax=Oidiodendron maius (strain Zn) TaxID=913774 RepID=A0A0C3GVQ2_OIDMZ|nr:hypothetical protein OIDMADRAFT_125382 [Oidiodendron maius Zn]